VYSAEVVAKHKVCGRAIVIKGAISFLGDVDPERCAIATHGKSLRGSIIAVEKFRGSTVGAYVIMALKKRGCELVGIVCSKPDPVVVAGCVLAEIPLAYGVPTEFFDRVSDGKVVCIDPVGKVIICGEEF